MAKPKKYPEVMELEVGGATAVYGDHDAVARAVAGYGKRSNPPRSLKVYGSITTGGQTSVFVKREPDPAPQP